MNRPTAKIAQLAGAALVGALLAGGGYALAASHQAKTIHGCINNKTRVLTVQTRCRRGQSQLRWNQRGPAGPAGPAGPQAVGAWGSVTISAQGAAVSGQNLAVTRTGAGTASVTITGGPCQREPSAVVATPEAGSPGFPTPVAYVSGNANGQFGLVVGTFTGGAFSTQDGIPVGVAVYCQP